MYIWRWLYITTKSTNFTQLIAKISGASLAIESEIRPVLEEAALLVKNTAEEKFGHYQSDVGPFKGWSAMSSDYLTQKINAGGGDTPLIGVPSLNRVYGAPLKDTIEYTVGEDELGWYAVIGSDDPLAEWHEFGTGNRGQNNPLPPRPFLRPALWQNKDKIVVDLGVAISNSIHSYFTK